MNELISLCVHVYVSYKQMQTTLFTYAGISVLFAVTCYGNSGTRIPWNADVASNRCNFDLELHEGSCIYHKGV